MRPFFGIALVGFPVALATVSCTTVPVEPAAEYRPCLPTDSEFPPSACAELVGRLLVADGGHRNELFVVVDTLDEASGSWFVAAPTRVSPDGRFELLVVEIRELGSRPVSDRVKRTLELRVHRSDYEARSHQNVLYAQPIPMVFTPWGQLVDPTHVTVSVVGR
jgi:hypothetical protein